MAKKDKERYEKEMKEYKASGGSKKASSPKLSKSKTVSSNPSPSKSKNKSQEFVEDSTSSSEDSD